ncbi:MAG: glycosyltransferase family 9 protein [Pirellulales bacterium]|nr:glycosyltransferase family 9 protein [Pirellulales bacterium]
MLHALSVALQNHARRLTTNAERRARNPRIARVLASPRTIVVTRQQCLGDMLVFLPTLEKLRERFPEARLIVLAKHTSGRELLTGAPLVDEVLVAGSGFRDKLRVIRELRRRHVDLFVISAQDRGRIPWALACGAKVILGFPTSPTRRGPRRDKLASLLSLRAEYDVGRTELENELELAAALGASIDNWTWPAPWYNPADAAQVATVLRRRGLQTDERFVVISPLAKRENKLWEPSRWAAVARHLEVATGTRIVLTGTAADRASLEQIRGDHRRWINLAGELSIGQLTYLLTRAALLMTVDSGPMHLAAALDTPLVALCGPTDLRRWRPSARRGRHAIISRASPCAPCHARDCPLGHHRCMLDISVSQVVDAALRMLGDSSPAIRPDKRAA